MTVKLEELERGSDHAPAELFLSPDAVAEALLPLAALDAATLKARRREKYLEAGREGLA